MGYPIDLVSLAGRRALVVGGGAVAAQKIPALVEAGAAIAVIAPAFSAEVRALAGPAVQLVERSYDDGDVQGAAVVIVATDDRAINARVAAAARQAGALVNVVDEPALCDFYAPAVVRRGAVTVAVSTGGAAPLLAARLRRLFEALLPVGLGSIAELFQRARRLGARGLARRDRLLEVLVDPGVGLLVERGELEAAAARVASRLDRPDEPFPPGTVAIVGAGPGGRGLLTLRALDRIHRADVILHDALVDDEILAEAPPGARLVLTGRRARGACVPQSLTMAQMIHEAKAGRRVVRLHGGDPCVFGRGGEEIEALRAASVPYELVPGVSAAVAAPSAAGVPLTLRGVARGFSVRTGHTDQGRTDGRVSPDQETVVVLMGLRGAAEICAGLIAEGRAAETPAIAVASAQRPEQRVVRGTLADLASRIAEAGLESPATLVVGEVARLAFAAGAEEGARACA